MKNSVIHLFLGLSILFVQLLSAQEAKVADILIVTASKNGSTTQIGAKIKEHLESAGFMVDTLSATPVKIDLRFYHLIVIGSGIYGGVPHLVIKAFIDSNRAELLRKKVAVFAVCGKKAAKSTKKRAEASGYIDSVAYGLNPVSKIVFAGKIPSYGLGNPILRLALGAGPGDYRNWEAIKEWSNSLFTFIK